MRTSASCARYSLGSRSLLVATSTLLLLLKITQMGWEGETPDRRISPIRLIRPERICTVWPLGDGADGPAVHVEGPHLPIVPRPVPVFD